MIQGCFTQFSSRKIIFESVALSIIAALVAYVASLLLGDITQIASSMGGLVLVGTSALCFLSIPLHLLTHTLRSQ